MKTTANNPAGAPANTEAGKETAVLAKALHPLGQTAKRAAQAGVVDDLSLAALGLTPPGKTR